MNGLSNLNETYGVYSLAPIDGRVKFSRSEVKDTGGRVYGNGI